MQQRGVADYYRFSVFNVISFVFLAGNIITLYALRFNASTVIIGLISASYQANLVFTLLGRYVVPRLGAVRTFGFGWMVRYVFMLPLLLTQLPSIRSRPNVVLVVIVVCAWGFNLAKGIGVAGTKPIVGELAPRGKLGRVISTHHLITTLGMIATGLVLAFALGAESPLGRYGVLLSIGVLSGLVAAIFILRLPEPTAAAAGYSTAFLVSIRRAFRSVPFRRFAIAAFTSGFATAMVKAFLVVYFKVVYLHADNAIIFFGVAGSVGATVTALISRAVSDRIGAKTLFFFYAGLIVLVCAAAAGFPNLTGAMRYIFPTAMFFLATMGQFGVFNTTELYFYSVTAAEDRLDFGIVAALARGTGGLAGSFIGGVFLSLLQRPHAEGSSVPFSIYFATAALVMVIALVQIFRLSDAGSPTMRQVLAMLLSRRSARARDHDDPSSLD